MKKEAKINQLGRKGFAKINQSNVGQEVSRAVKKGIHKKEHKP